MSGELYFRAKKLKRIKGTLHDNKLNHPQRIYKSGTCVHRIYNTIVIYIHIYIATIGHLNTFYQECIRDKLVRL